MTVLPPDFSPPFTPVLFALADCVCTELATTGGGPTCWCGLVPGALVSWEFCGECDGGKCGMGYVRVDGVVPYNVFPVAEIDLNCARPLAIRVEVGALRCIPVAEELPSPETLAEVTAIQMMDIWALYRALMCCGASAVAAEAYVPVGPEGGCVGGFWTAFLGFD